LALQLTFGGMWRCLRVAVARVFALVVRCGIVMLFVYCRVGKNRDTRRESPAAAGAGRTADHLTILFSQKILAVRRGNDIYRPVMHSYFSSNILLDLGDNRKTLWNSVWTLKSMTSSITNSEHSFPCSMHNNNQNSS